MYIELNNPEQFRRLMEKRGVTVDSLARVMGVGESYAARILNGQTHATPQEALKICKVFGLLFEHIFKVNHSMLGGTKMGEIIMDNPVRTEKFWDEEEADQNKA